MRAADRLRAVKMRKTEDFDNVESPLNKKCVNNKEREAYKKPIKNIFQGPFSALFGLINDSNILYKEKEIF